MEKEWQAALGKQFERLVQVEGHISTAIAA